MASTPPPSHDEPMPSRPWRWLRTFAPTAAFRLSFLPPLVGTGDRAGDLGYQVRRQLLRELARMDREHGSGLNAAS